MEPISISFVLIGFFIGASVGSVFKEEIIAWAKQAIVNLTRTFQQIKKGVVRIIRKGGRFIKSMIVKTKENIQKLIQEYIEDYLVPEIVHDELDKIQDKLGLEDYEEVSTEVLELQIK